MAYILNIFVCVVMLSLYQPILCQNELKEAMIALIKDCQEKTGASEADIETLRQHKLPESKEGVCMFECFFDNAKVMQNGKFNQDGLVAALTPMVQADPDKIAKLKEMATVCGKEIDSMEEADKCEVAKKLMHCTVEQGKQFGFEYPSDFK